MRRWKVGSFTAALVLISAGILLLIGQFTEIRVLDMVAVLWPAALIVLGVEILIYSILAVKDGDPNRRMEFSGLSLFVVLAVFVCSIVLSGILLTADFVEAGLLDRCRF